MSDQTSFFEGFYVHYLLHDIYVKIIPGSIVLISLQVARQPTLDELSVVLSRSYSVGWVFIIGLAWTVGFSLQALGKHWSTQWGNPAQRYNLRINFFRKANQFERSQLQRYSLVIDTTGNAGKAFLVSTVVLTLSNVVNLEVFLRSHWSTIMALVILSGALLVVSKQYIGKQGPYMEAVGSFDKSAADLPSD
jgi:hypothetical protein